MKLTAMLKCIGRSLIELGEPVQVRAARMAAEAIDRHASLNYQEAKQYLQNTLYVLQRFDSRAAEPQSVHRHIYRDYHVAVDTAVAWIISQYEARGLTDFDSIREKLAIQYYGTDQSYTLVVSDDGDYWVIIKPVRII